MAGDHGAVLAVPFLLRATGSLALTGNLFTATVFGSIATANASPGGCLGALLCSCVIPFVGVMLCGRRAGVVWGFLAVAQLWFALSATRAPRSSPSLTGSRGASIRRTC